MRYTEKLTMRGERGVVRNRDEGLGRKGTEELIPNMLNIVH